MLDVGTAGGHVARALRERGCTVWGVELDPVAARVAEGFCEAIVVGDIEELDLGRELAGLTFDAVLFLDVLEHLREPGAALLKVRPLLTEGGRIVASIPNVTHAALRLELLNGRFRYRDIGLLDRTHLRFFDAEGVRELFAGAGFTIDEELRVTRRINETEFDLDLDSFPVEVLDAATRDPESSTYQFIVVASTAGKPDPVPRQATLLELLQRERDDLRHRLEEALGRTPAEQVEVEARMSELEEELRRERELRRQVQLDLTIKDEYLAELRSRIRTGQPLYYPTLDTPDPLQATRYRIADWINDSIRRIPGLHKGIRWVLRKAMALRR